MTKKTVKHMIIVLMLLAIGLYFISGTYARYTSTASGDAKVTVAQWAVAINNTDLTATATTLEDITFTEVPNDYVVDGVIAPASQLYADFVIDPNGSQVAIDYSFKISEITGADGLSIEVSKVMVGDKELEKDTDGNYTGTIKLAQDQKTALTSSDAVTVRVYVEWTNSEANNTDDTTAGLSASELTMTVTATAEQHIATATN